MAHRRYADREPLNLNMQGIIYQYKIGNKLYVGKTLALERKRQAKHKFEAYKLHKETPPTANLVLAVDLHGATTANLMSAKT